MFDGMIAATPVADNILLERFKALHRTGQLLDETMILLNHVVEILNLRDVDQPEPYLQQQQPLHVLQACEVRATLVDD